MRVKKVKYLHDYKLEILFSDEKTKIVDLSDLINEGGFYFDPLKDIEFFKQVSLDDEKYPLSICWPNDADICPDVLYEMGKDIQEQKKPVKAKPRKGVYLLFEKDLDSMLTLVEKDIDTVRTLACKLMKSNPEIPCEFK